MIRLVYTDRIRQSASGAVLLAGLILCAGCGGSEEEPAEAAATPANIPTTEAAADTDPSVAITTGPGKQQADNQLEFFTEKYLKAEERLKRRQDRLKSALSQ